MVCRGKERRRLRSDIDLGGDDDLYIGKHASRKAFFGDDERMVGHDPAMPSSDDTSDSSDDYSEENHDDDDDDDEEEDRVPEYSMEGRGHPTHVDDKADMLEKEVEDVEEAEAQVAEELKDRAAKEYRKALCVKAQKRLWNASLESRIMVQKVVQGAHRLPSQDVHPYIGDVDPSLADEMRAVSIDAERSLDDMCAVLDALVEQNTSIQRSKRKRDATGGTIEQVWEALDERYREIAPFRDTSLDRWHRKTMLTGGSASKASLKVLNQTVSKQVALVMKDSERIAERSRVPVAQYKGLCQLHSPAVDGMKITEVRTSIYAELLTSRRDTHSCRKGRGCRVFHLRNRNLLEICTLNSWSANSQYHTTQESHTWIIMPRNRHQPITYAYAGSITGRDGTRE